MKFLADESVDQQVVERLRQRGHLVWYVADMEPGIPDETILEMADREDALLLTADKDFGELVFRQLHLAPGVVLIRLAGLSSSRKADIMDSAVLHHQKDLVGSFSVVSPGAIRIRPWRA